MGVSEATDKGLISKIYKQPTQLNTRKRNNPSQKLGEGGRPKQTFLLRRHTDGQQHIQDAQHHSLLEKCKSKPQ